jgi:NHS family xanthosine MFS transporter
LFVETTTDAKKRSSAQGMFMMMTNGVGAVLGSLISGWAIDKFFTRSFTALPDLAKFLDTNSQNTHLLQFIDSQGISANTAGELSKSLHVKDWPTIWLTFAIYALIITVLFALLFKHKHNAKDAQAIDNLG